MMKELRAGAPVTVAGITLIPIERMELRCESRPQAYWLSATKEVLAVVICAPEGPRALDVEGQQQSVEAFIREIPELASLVTECLPP